MTQRHKLMASLRRAPDTGVAQILRKKGGVFREGVSTADICFRRTNYSNVDTPLVR